MSLTATDRPMRSLTARVRKMDGQHYVGDRQNVFELDEVGQLIWKLADGQHTVQQIADAIAADYDVTPDEALADTADFLAELQRHGFLQDPLS